jgi:hypothetical protein
MQLGLKENNDWKKKRENVDEEEEQELLDQVHPFAVQLVGDLQSEQPEVDLKKKTHLFKYK